MLVALVNKELCAICNKDWYCTCNNECNKEETK